MSDTAIDYNYANYGETLAQIQKLSLGDAIIEFAKIRKSYDKLIKEYESQSSLYTIEDWKVRKERFAPYEQYALWLVHERKYSTDIKFEEFINGKYNHEKRLYLSDWTNGKIKKEIRKTAK